MPEVHGTDAANTASFAYELGVLKRARRAGWWHVGIRDPESVAEHSLRVAQLAAIIAAEEGADPARASYLGLWHDTHETRIGDMPHTARPYLTAMPDHEAITRDQVAGMPDPAAKTVIEAVIEFEAGETLEAQCAADADKLECLLQAVEYRDAGYRHVDQWIDTSKAALTTSFAASIAAAALSISPLNWRS